MHRHQQHCSNLHKPAMDQWNMQKSDKRNFSAPNGSIFFYGTPCKQGKANKPESWHTVLLLDLCRLHEPWQNLSCSYPLVLPPSKQGSQGHFWCRNRKIHFDRSRRNTWHTPDLCWHSQDTSPPSFPLSEDASHIQDKGDTGTTPTVAN